MKTKLLTLLLAVAASVGTMFAWDYERLQIGDLYYNLDATNKTAEVTSQNSSYPYWSTTITTAIIPALVKYKSVSYSVTSIGGSAFYWCTGLTSVTIPNSVTSIGDNAFYRCTGLTSVTIPNSVTSIGNYAFSHCTGLTSVTIPNSVTSIGDDAFYGCSGFPVIDNIRYADKYLIEAVDKTLSTYTIKDGTKWIGGWAFDGCTGLTSVTIPNSVTRIGRSAFRGCTGLTSVTIGNSVTSIGYEAFWDCIGLTSIEIPNSVTTIGPDAFLNCRGLTSVTIPNSVTSIEDGAFSYCNGLKKVNITDIAAWCNITFGNSSNPLSSAKHLYVNDVEVTDLVIPNSVTSIGGSAFYGCSGLTSVTIPNSVTSIGWRAFYGCSGLTSVTIPNSVTSIGNDAFYMVNNIVYSGIATRSPWGAKSVNGYVEGYLVYNDATKTKLLGCSSAVNGEIVISNSVTSIGSDAFSGCTDLTSVTIPDSVTSIGDRAFYGCSGLTSVTIPDSVTSIGDRAFYGCSGLTSVIWNAKNYADFASNNTPFYANYYEKWYDNYVQFDLRPQITSFTFGNEVEHIPANLCNGMSNLTSIEIPNSVTSIGNNAFSGCTGLTSIEISNSVTSIGEGVFENCTGLTSVTIGNSVTSIGNNVFSGCTGLTSVTIGNSVTSIGNNVFSGCTSLTSVTCLAPTPPTCWGSSCFSGVNCSNIPLYVPMESVSLYQAANIWKEFNVIGVMFADKVETAVFSATPTDDYGVILEWQAVENAVLYNIDIIQGNDTIRKLQFDSNGKLLNSPSNAPSRYPNIHHASTAILSGNGWRCEVNDLDPGTNYTYSITVKAENGSVLYTQSIGFTTKEETFIIKFVNWNGEELLVLPEVVKGTTPSYTGETPVRPNTAEYTYTFVGWTPAVVAVTGDATYKATFTATKNSYTITWQNEDGSLIDQTTVEYGVVPTHTDPIKQNTAEYTYTFAGWTPTVVAVTGNATYKATFTATKNSYTITWQNEDGSLIDQTTVEYGVVPTHAEPTKQATAEYTYTFTGWTPAVVAVTGDATYKATFSSVVNVYTISVSAANGQVIGGGEYQYGATIDLTAIPNEGYVFDQWSDGVTDNPRTITVTGDVEYTALFKSAEGLENIYTSEPVQKVIIDQKVFILRGEKVYTIDGRLVKESFLILPKSPNTTPAKAWCFVLYCVV